MLDPHSLKLREQIEKEKQKMTQLFNLISTWLILTSSSLLIPHAASYDFGIHETGLTCGASESPGSSASKFMAIMDTVSFQVKERGWGAQTLLGSGPPMYALGQCRRDLRPTECYTCFTQARQVLSRCVPKTAGRIYLDGCFLRYDNYSFFRESVDPTRDISVCQSSPGLRKDGEGRVAAAVANATKGAAECGFAVAGVEGVFALAQCWGTLDKGTCERCLNAAGTRVQECVPNAQGRSLFTGCFLRYSTRKFYNDVALHGIKDSTNSREGPSTVWLMVACVLLAIVGLLLVVLAAFICRKRIASSRRNKISDSCGASPGFAYVTGFSFRYDLLEKATNYFDPANKLGEGGAGSVFKGTLPSGGTVAVKRLFFNARQWTEGFFNELNLINEIQHKNVVKLLGCSIDGPESLLVYEFVPRGNLDQVLFGKNSENALNWEQRFRIICGIAEGLAYLHGGPGKKIIHRDIKSSNILFDENLNPKIADFGLARSVAENKSLLSIGNAETLGYMAPEYVINGQLTEKADIYAFGVLVIEIVSGKKNSDYIPESTSVLHSVWKNYNANIITSSVDPTLHGKFTAEEASNALQAGLLCTQSSDTLRPSMSEVVQMLTKKDYVIPSPNQQPFLNSIARILSSNGHASARSSFHSTTSSLIPNDDVTVLENSFSPYSRFNPTGSPDSNIQILGYLSQGR
ncbi:Cysteine-rich receptor-like protein kinase 42 [Glycine soja]|nr:Cysteine-rich receptor-like protein kinase 42 [Glycine soja]